MGGSQQARGVGGEDGVHAGEGGRAVAFHPLAAIDCADERAWAAEWIGALLAHEHVVVTPEIKESLWSALNSLATAPIEARTLTGLSLLLQSAPLRSALAPYPLEGPFGGLLAATADALALSTVPCFCAEA